MDVISVLLVSPKERSFEPFSSGRAQGIVVRGLVADATSAVRALRFEPVDVFLVDVDAGVETVAAIRGAAPTSCVLAWTTEDDPYVAALALSAGATGMLPRTLDPGVLRDALRRALAGELILPDGHLRSLFTDASGEHARIGTLARLASLTAREREVLDLVAEGWSTRDVAARLGISAGTVQSHVKSILAKLGVHSKIEAVRIAWRDGGVAVPA